MPGRSRVVFGKIEIICFTARKAMTLILGANLCDRIYLAADTRLSQKDKSGAITDKKDQILKIVPFTQNVIGAFAGHAGMSSYIANELVKVIPADMDIRSFQSNARKLIAPLTDAYWTKEGATRIAIIFGGVNRNERKKLNSKRIYDEVMRFSKLDGNQQMHMKPALFNTMTPPGGTPRYPEPADSHVFSVLIQPPNIFSLEEAEWGDFLAYGPKGITKDHIHPTLFGKLEFATTNNSAGKDNSMMAAAVRDVAKRYQEETIGGPTITMMVAEEGVGLITGKIDAIDINTMQSEFISDTFVEKGQPKARNEKGEVRDLVSIRDYRDFGSLFI